MKIQRRINKIAVLGSGVMGSRIACLFAGIGVQVLLLDIAPQELTESEKQRGLTLDQPAVKNRIVNEALQAAVKSRPSPVYTTDDVKNITTGNFDDNMTDIASCDWIIEVVVENLGVKRQVFEQVERYRKAGTLITSNTSGIPIHLMTEGRSEDFKAHFCGTHFFNPPRYLRLLEIIPAPDTKEEVLNFLMHYGDLFLGKTTVLCKDTPAFIANRIGVFSIMAIFHIMEKLELTIDEVDALTGTIIGRPKSATFRTADVVGIDTLYKVAKGLMQNCPEDEAKEIFKVPDFLEKIVSNKWLGDKNGQGFYKKIKTDKGSGILTLDLKSFEYAPRKKASFPSLEMAKPIENLHKRLKLLIEAEDKAGEFYRLFHYYLFSYISHRIPEIADELFKIDDAMKAGFGWEIGPFESWDILDVKKRTEQAEEAGFKIADWVKEMLQKGINTFYKKAEGKKYYYALDGQDYLLIPGTQAFIILENYANNIIWKNNDCSLYDIDDGILNIAFHSKKLNTIGAEVLSGINKAIEIAEKDFRGLVIGNEGQHFSAGANIGIIFMLATEQEFEELDIAVRQFQQTNMNIRYSAVPIVAAPHGMSLGGGCEICLHADAVQAAAETYMGLVELGVGLIPAGGGTKEYTLRASEEFKEGEIQLPELQQRFLSIGMTKVSTSAADAYSLGSMQKGKDHITMNQNRLIADAKDKAIELSEQGYVKPALKSDIKVWGRQGLGALLTGINSMYRGNYISQHDVKIAQKLAYVMCGGDLSAPTLVSEQYLLDLEREAFLSLCAERKTLERMQAMLKTGKALRN